MHLIIILHIMNIEFTISNLLKIKYIDGEKATANLLARKIGVSQPYMSNLVNNKVTPSLSLLQRIAEVFQVTLPDLFADEKQTKIISLTEFEGAYYKAQTLSELKSIVEIIEDKNLLYYNLWSRSQSDNLRKLSGGGIQENDKKFLDELEKRKDSSEQELDFWLRGLIAMYMRKRAENDTDYPLEYYVNWLNHTRLLTKEKYPKVYNWCLEYESFLLDYMKEKDN